MNRVAVVAGCRTPFVRAGTVFKDYTSLELGKHVVTSLIRRAAFDPTKIDELVFGSVLIDPRTSNLAREIILRTDLPKSISAHFVSNNCITGLVATSKIYEGILSGRIRSGIAGGVESMSTPTLTLSNKAEKFFLSLARARSTGEKFKILTKFRAGFLIPKAPSPKEPSTGLTMGEHCEITTKQLSIPRNSQDELALKSHLNAFKAQNSGYLSEEIAAVNEVSKDNLIRGDTSLEKLTKLNPVFDRSGKGTLTAGNSSALTDGASCILLMSEQYAKSERLEILGFIEGIEFAAISPSDGLLMAPGIALPRLLSRMKLRIDDIDQFEIHEAFAAQVLSNLMAWEKGWRGVFPNSQLDIPAIGAIPTEKINVNGGSIAIGHPFAATGGRLILSLCNQLKRSGKRTGVISVCAAGAMGCAVLIRRP